MSEDVLKLMTAIKNVKPNVEYTIADIQIDENAFNNNIKWKQSDNTFSNINPHSELSWAAVKAEMDKL